MGCMPILSGSVSVTLTNNTITGNLADGNGGGILVEYFTIVTLTNNIITGNSSENGDGGGVYASGLYASGSQ